MSRKAAFFVMFIMVMVAIRVSGGDVTTVINESPLTRGIEAVLGNLGTIVDSIVVFFTNYVGPALLWCFTMLMTVYGWIFLGSEGDFAFRLVAGFFLVYLPLMAAFQASFGGSDDRSESFLDEQIPGGFFDTYRLASGRMWHKWKTNEG